MITNKYYKNITVFNIDNKKI